MPRARRARRAIARAIPILGVILGGMALWEVLKAALGIPDFKLPHTYAIVGELFRRTGRGDLWVAAPGRNPLLTGGGALVGFLGRGLPGFTLPAPVIH